MIKGHRRSKESTREAPPEPAASEDIPCVDSSYLLVSPLLPPVSSLATMSFFKASRKDQGYGHLVRNSTLAIFGDKDSFTPIKKLRSWAERLSGEADSKFEYHAVYRAGHFWREAGAHKELRERIREWISKQV